MTAARAEANVQRHKPRQRAVATGRTCKCGTQQGRDEIQIENPKKREGSPWEPSCTPACRRSEAVAQAKIHTAAVPVITLRQ